MSDHAAPTSCSICPEPSRGHCENCQSPRCAEHSTMSDAGLFCFEPGCPTKRRDAIDEAVERTHRYLGALLAWGEDARAIIRAELLSARQAGVEAGRKDPARLMRFMRVRDGVQEIIDVSADPDLFHELLGVFSGEAAQDTRRLDGLLANGDGNRCMWFYLNGGAEINVYESGTVGRATIYASADGRRAIDKYLAALASEEKP